MVISNPFPISRDLVNHPVEIPGEGYVFHVKTPKQSTLDFLKKPLNLLVDPSDVC